VGRKIKAVYFNSKTEAPLLDFADGLENFSEWVKGCIRRELWALETGIDPAIEELVERLLETKLAGRVVAQTDQDQEMADEDISNDLDAFF